MARRVLPAIDLSGQPTSLQQNVQAITNILQTIGQAEKIRRERQTLDRVATAIAGGASTIEAISAVAQQQPQFGTGLQGILQKIGGAFQPPGGGIQQGIQQSIIGQVLQKALAPPSLLTPEERVKGAKIKAGLEPRAVAEKPTKIQELVNEGYSREEAQMIRDISHGLKPRASVRKQYENLDDVEKMDFLSKLKQRAEGQYFGVEGGNVQPRQPKLLKWVNEELGKLQMLSESGATPETQLAEPQSKEEFLKTVQSIEDEDKAEAYYNKWVSKWQ